MRKSTAILTSALCFFIGIIVGFAFAPIKHGLSISNNGNNNGNYCDCCSNSNKKDNKSDYMD